MGDPYYDAEGALRTGFLRLLAEEGRRRVLDVGAGPGLDTIEFQSAGLDAMGLDLAPANAAVMRGRGFPALAGSLYALPFPDACFDALWTMSTFVHVPDDRFDHALGELLRVVRVGAPVAIGTWGGQDFEGVPEFGEHRPLRFFSLAAHARWRAMLGRHAAVEHFETFAPTDPSTWEYQFAVLRRRA